MNNQRDSVRLQKKIWNGVIPLEIRLADSESRTFHETDPYLILCPRLSYYPLFLQRLRTFFASYLIDPNSSFADGWLSYENVPLKWHYPIGLLYDLYSGSEPSYPLRTRPGDEPDDNIHIQNHTPNSGESPLPWKLVVHFADWPDDQLIRLDVNGKVLHDAFMNSVKEADFLRNGSAKAVMSLSKVDSTVLWQSVKEHNLSLYNSINQKLLNPVGSILRHIPTRIYLPSAAISSTNESLSQGSFRVLQTLVATQLSSRHRQTIGTALNSIVPSLFPRQRTPLLAQPVLHGAVLPLTTEMEELAKIAAYADGWLHIIITMIG